MQAGSHGIGCREDEDVTVARVDHRFDLEVRWGQGDIIDDQAIGVGVAIGDDLDESAIGGARGDARHELDPLGVDALAKDSGRPCRRIDLEDRLAALVAREQRDEGRPGVGSRHSGEVGEGVVVPGHFATRAVQAHEPEGDIRVGRARGGIAVGARGDLRLCGIGDPPGGDGRIVAPLDEQA